MAPELPDCRSGAAAPLSVAALSEYAGTTGVGWDITTVTTPGREMGAEAVRLLADILDNSADRSPRRVVIDCGFHDGDTLAARA